MGVDLQKASMWKRISAFLFDAIVLCLVAVAFGTLLSWVTNYDGYNLELERYYAEYEQQYGVTFQITGEEYEALTEAEREAYDTAYATLIADEDMLYTYNMVLHLTMLITSIGILLAFLVLEFAVPMLFGNGQTLGKKIFSLAVIRTDAVRVNGLQLFIRTVLGKYTLETMIPVYIVIMIFFNMVGLGGTLLLAALLIAQAVLTAVTRTNSLIHDLLAGTVVVDYPSQMIFRSTEELVDYTKRIHAERAARQPY